MFVDDMYVVKGEFAGQKRMDLRKWCMERSWMNQSFQDIETIPIPKKMGQSLTFEQWYNLYQKLDDIEAAVETSKRCKDFDKKFDLGGKARFTVSGSPYHKCQIRTYFMPKALHQKRVSNGDLENIEADLRPSHNGAVFPTLAFPRFKEIVKESFNLIEFKKCGCENPKLCSFCSPYTHDIQKKIDQAN